MNDNHYFWEQNFSNASENLGGGKIEWINDGLCDDMNNNEACNYDDGDCCGVYVKRNYCLQCECLCES